MDDKKKIPELTLRAHLLAISRDGGRSRSARKLEACRRNAVKAFQARFPGRPLTPRLLEITGEMAETEDEAGIADR